MTSTSSAPLALSDALRIAHLARLELSADEAGASRTMAQLNDFFALVEQMRTVDTTGVEPLAHPAEQTGAIEALLRDDCVTEAVEREQLQRCAPSIQDGLYLVPRVIE
jgi:aspartyl-tRNA(Asn)/glutamyl-tRNA(Gln) amidotransferase subunit C